VNVLDVPAGRVSIGFPVALAALLATELFVRVRTAYPQILLHIVDGNSGLLRERLNNGRLDISVLLTGQAERGLAVEPLVLEELFYATADQDRSPVRIAEAARHPLLVPGPDSGIQRDAREVFEKYGLTLEPIGECDSLNTMRELVASGIGNSIMTWSGLHSGDPRLALLRGRDPGRDGGHVFLPVGAGDSGSADCDTGCGRAGAVCGGADRVPCTAGLCCHRKVHCA